MSLHSSSRRTFVFAGLAIAGALLAACSETSVKWSGTNIAGALPDLQFTMTRAHDAKEIRDAAYDGKVRLLYFGYTYCPDVCPLTLSNITQVLKGLGDKADEVRVLFVTVDPDRDTLDALKNYASAFAPQVVGLRGTPDQLASLAKRFRVAYSAGKDESGEYVVTHSPAVYAFDRQGEARLLYTGLSGGDAETAGMTEDLKRLIDGDEAGGLLSWL